MSAAPTSVPAPEVTSPNSAPSGRDARGRFAKGNPGGAGNPFARRVAALRSVLLDSISADDLAAIVRALIAKARTGDVAAAKLIFAYGLGRPAPTVDPDRLDVEEWQHFKDTTPMYAEMPRVGMAPQPELPLNMVRMSRPVMSELCGRQMKEMLREPPAESACQEAPDVDSPPSPNGEMSPPSPPDPVDAVVLESLLGLDEFARVLDPALRALFRDLLAPSPDGEITVPPAPTGRNKRASGHAAAPVPAKDAGS
jgi:hypothetical protein